MKSVKKIDIHAHANAFPEYSPSFVAGNNRDVTAEDVIEYYDKLNIEKGILLPVIAPEAHVNIKTSSECKYLSDKYPERFLWFCSVDPRMVDNTETADLGKLIEFYKSIGAKGIGELCANMYADHPKMDNLFYHCAKCNMPVTIHIASAFDRQYGIVDDLGLPRIEKMLKKHPDLKLFGHSMMFWSEISGDNNDAIRGNYPTGKVKPGGKLIYLMREYGNLYCDLSAGSGANAMMRDREFAAGFFEEFADRIMYGCDLCIPGQTFAYDFDAFLDGMVEDGLLSMENYKKIVRENAIRIIGL